jgi:hypothetical protein
MVVGINDPPTPVSLWNEFAKCAEEFTHMWEAYA